MRRTLSTFGFIGSDGYKWSFVRSGGFDQVKIRHGEDIKHLENLDPKLWAALSCPTRGVHFDNRTLDLIDTDKDGRIRVPDIVSVSKWVCSLLKNPDLLLEESETLALDQINDETEEGRRILDSAHHILESLGKEGAKEISVDDVSDQVRIFANTSFNGDGVIPEEATDDPEIRRVISECIQICGSVMDRSGRPGIDTAKLEQFFADLQAYSDWWKMAEDSSEEIWPLGDRTADAFAAFDEVDAKIDDYFARTRLAAYDHRAQAALNRHEAEYLSIAAKDLAISADEVAGFPLAQIVAGTPLPLRQALNPAWVERMEKFYELVVVPILGEQTTLTEAQYLEIKKRFSAYAAWNNAKQGGAVEQLGLARVREILASNARATIEGLIAEDKELEEAANSIAMVEKLVRLNRDLHRLLINFVNFRDFYDDDDEMAIFQAGKLYLDQRCCSLCVKVDDIAKHGTLAPLSRVYLAYCECVRRGGTEKMQIAAAFTAGDSDNLMVGRNGVFFDRDNQDWDATIVKIFENPISIRQAFWSPYKRVLRWVEEQIAKRAAAADMAATETLTSAAGSAIESAATGQVKAKPKFDVGVVAALGVAVGGITAALGALLQAFFNLGWLMPLGILALILLISGPSMVIAWLKLRQRNLGPILDANGWAVNTRAKINIPFGAKLTSVAKLPPNSHRDLRDPYAESKMGRIWAASIIVVLAAVWAMWYFGVLHKWFPTAGIPKSGWLERREAQQAAGDATSQPSSLETNGLRILVEPVQPQE